MALLDRLIRAAEARPFHPLLMLYAATWVTGVRFLEEKAFVYDVRTLPLDNHGALVSWLCFYLALGYGIAAILVHVAQVVWQRAVQIVAFALTLAILPPIVDILVYGRGNFSYRYQESFFSDTTFLLFNHKQGLPIGEGLIVWGSIVLVGLYTFHKTRVWWRAALAAALMYSFS
ncbi:MAG: hypothetical protein JXR83_18690, partial [Deltaproteobacteria bacterium]|nr:hypothetical protein [Deltaproteobacteria bacterium]